MIWTAASREPRWASAEVGQVAVAFARTGSIADAYLPGQGPTAHLNPITPAFAGTVYYLLGIRSPAAEALLTTCAIAVAIASFACLYGLFGRLGTPRWARLLALAGCCFLPVYQGMETSEFRAWEGGLSVLLATGYMLVLVGLDDATSSVSLPRRALLAVWAALTFFLSPALGLALYAATGLFVLARIPARRWLGWVVSAVVALAAIVMPWVLRNERALGAPVLLRSNFGLELAMGYDPAALTATDRARAFQRHQDAIHPFGNPTVYHHLQAAGGEVAYAKLLGRQTEDWMRAHPVDALMITGQHFRDYLFPPRWQLRLSYKSPMLDIPRLVILWTVSAMALVGIVIALARRERVWLYPVLLFVLPTMLYTLTQPVLRYHYLIFALSLFLGAEAIAWLAAIRWLGARQGPV